MAAEDKCPAREDQRHIYFKLYELNRSFKAARGRSFSDHGGMNISNLLTKKQQLRPVNTKLTTLDGKVFIENRDSSSLVTQMDALFYVLDRGRDTQVAEVMPHLLLGSQDVATNLELLLWHRVTHILNAASFVDSCFPDRFVYKRVEIADLPCVNIRQYFDECNAFIHAARLAGGRVLVHCNAGVSRSVTFVVAYLVSYENYTVVKALEHVRSIRPCARPNDGFLKQLMDFEKERKKNL